MFEKQIVNDKIEILENGIIQVCEVTRILEDDVQISEKITNRRIIEPGADTSAEPQEIVSISGVVHTKEVIAKYKAKKEARELELLQIMKQKKNQNDRS